MERVCDIEGLEANCVVTAQLSPPKLSFIADWELPWSGLHLWESPPSSDPSPGRVRTTPIGYLGCSPKKEYVVSGVCVVSPALFPSPGFLGATREHCIKRGHLLFGLIWLIGIIYVGGEALLKNYS